MKPKEIREHLAEINEEAIIYDNLEEALVGIGHRFGMQGIAIYDLDKVMICLEKELGPDITDEEVIEYFDYNVIGTWAGEHTPMFIETF